MKYTKSKAKAYAKEHMKGVWAAITTPFKPTGEMDEEGLRSNLRRCINDLKVDGFFCNGLMGEFWSLTPQERMRAQEIVCQESKGKAQVMPHTAHTNITEVLELTDHAEKMGADYVIIINPVYGANEDDEIFLYFETIAKQTNMGIALFNQPKSGVTLGYDLIERLCDIPNICAIKNAMPLEHTQEVRRRVGDRVVVCDPWEEDMLVAMAHFGMQVFNSSFAPYIYQVPGYTPMKDVYDAIQEKDMVTAWKISYEMEPLRAVMRKYFTTGPNGRTTAYLKEWTKLLGMATGEPRPPIVPLTDQQRKEFHDDLAKTGILDKLKS
jgi:4-hydroxy-tetrahydrodipicolinate synthase